METTSGVKITRGSGGPPKPLIIDVAQALGVKPAPAPDPRLVENASVPLSALMSRTPGPSAQSNGSLSP